MKTASLKQKRNLALLLGAGGLIFPAGCAQGMDPALAARSPQPVAMTVSLCDSGETGCSSGTSFRLSVIRDLGVGVDWKNVPGGTHTQQIALVQPNGVVYQTVSHSFGVPDNKLGAPKIADVIPIAGTFITQRDQVGEWSIEVSLDGQTVGTQKFQFDE